MLNRLFIFIAVLSLAVSCKTTKVGGTADCPKKSVAELEEVLRNKRQTPFDFFYSKIAMDVKDSKQSNSFKAYLKMKPDSAISGSVKVAGIVGAGFLVDHDTVAFTNKLKKCYKKESYSAFTDMFGTEVSYDFIEELVLGHPIGLSTIEELYPLKNDHYYVLATHDRKVMERLSNNNLDDEEQQMLFIQYYMNCSDLTLSKIIVDAPKDGVSISIDFVERQQIENIDFPKETAIKIISPEDSVFIDMKYSEPQLNKPKKIKLTISDSYSECE